MTKIHFHFTVAMLSILRISYLLSIARAGDVDGAINCLLTAVIMASAVIACGGEEASLVCVRLFFAFICLAMFWVMPPRLDLSSIAGGACWAAVWWDGMASITRHRTDE